MGIIDSTLNIACVLLWFNWRSALLTARERSSPVSLAATLKKAEPRRSLGWLSLATLLLVLGLRSLFYWNVGWAWRWTPHLELGVISLPFRSDYQVRMVVFSGLSFALIVGTLYAWLLLISIVNRKLPNEAPWHKLVRLHLGWVEYWPTWLKVLLPLIVTSLAWMLASRGLVKLGIVPAPQSFNHLWQQSLVLGLASYLIWKPLILGVCILYLLQCYIYLGNSQFWKYVNATGSNLLLPLRRLPLCLGKFDFAPLVAILIVAIASHFAAQWLPRLFERLPL